MTSMYDLTKFTLRDMTECGLAFRQLGAKATSMEETSQRIVDYIYNHFINQDTEEKSCALVRFFKTHSYKELDRHLQEYASAKLSQHTPFPTMKCLTLLATAGEQPQWNSRHESVAHKTIPLVSEQVVAEFPMISQLIHQFGLTINTVLEPDPELLIDLEQKTFNVFHVPEAVNSPHIPAQQTFVIPFNIQSVLGFGGLLPSGHLFAIIMFLKVQIPDYTANMFSTLALNVKTALLPFDRKLIFTRSGEFTTADNSKLTKIKNQDIEQLRSQVATLTQLLDVSEQTTLAQSDRLQTAINQLNATQQELIQSEKMAALGQLIAGIAHEVNTPLGAIHSSVQNISDFLAQTLRQLPDFFKGLSPQQQSYFFDLIKISQHQNTTLSTKQKRQFKRNLIRQLQAETIENYDTIADTLVDIGVFDTIEPFLPLLKESEGQMILNIAYQFTTLQKSTQTITTATDRAAKVVFALKTYARYDSMGEKVQADVIDGIETILTLYHNQLKQGIDVIRNYQLLPPILCYPDELNQVWTNLIHNAIQAMDYKGILQIDATQDDNHIVIQITDSGKGISSEIMPKIFEPFFTTKPSGEGSGLGLDIVKKIIDKHKGKIDVESEQNQTKFSIYLPINTYDKKHA